MPLCIENPRCTLGESRREPELRPAREEPYQRTVQQDLPRGQHRFEHHSGKVHDQAVEPEIDHIEPGPVRRQGFENTAACEQGALGRSVCPEPPPRPIETRQRRDGIRIPDAGAGPDASSRADTCRVLRAGSGSPTSANCVISFARNKGCTSYVADGTGICLTNPLSRATARKRDGARASPISSPTAASGTSGSIAIRASSGRHSGGSCPRTSLVR